MTLYPPVTQGSTFECGTQADYSTISAFGAPAFFRPEGSVNYPTKSQKTARGQANLGHSLDADFSDKAILIEQQADDAISFDYAMRRDVDGTNDPMIVTWAEAGGYSVVENSASTVAAYTDEGNFTTTADTIGADTEGQYILVQLDDGTYYPYFIRDYTSATKTCLGAMKLPSASSIGKVTQRMYTITPRTGEVTAAKLVSFRHRTRGKHTIAPDLAYMAKTCCLSGIGDISLTPNGDLRFPLSFSAADIYDASSTLVAESFRDGTQQNPIQGCECALANANSSATINNTQIKFDEITISNPYKAKFAAGEGSSTGIVNSTQAVMSSRESGDAGRAKVTIKAGMDRAWLTAFEAQTMRYFHCVKATSSLAVPAWAINIPRLEPVDFQCIREGSDWIQMEGTFLATSADYAATSGDNSEPGDRDIFIGVSGEA